MYLLCCRLTKQADHTLLRTFVLSLFLLPIAAIIQDASSAQAQATHTVINTNDNGAGSLRQHVMDAAPGDEISFDVQIFDQSILLSSGPIIIDKNLTITGLGADSLTISGNKLSGVFEILSDITATITGLTITGGFAEVNGGGIAVGRSANFTLDGAVITGNLAIDNGGGIYSGGGSTTLIKNSIIADNEAQGALSPNGGAVYNAGGFVIIENCQLTGNNSIRGGAVWNSGSGKMEIHTSTITGNMATSEGGGVFNNNKLTITNSTISGNQAELEAGGIKNRGGDTLMVENSTISKNVAGQAGGILNQTFGTAVIHNTTIYRNQSTLPGAGIKNNDTAKITIYSTIIAANIEDGFIQSDILDLSSITSLGYNFIGNGDADNTVVGSKRFARQSTDLVGFSSLALDPELDDLADNAGPTPTHAPLARSPIIDNGDCKMTSSDTDQSGTPRVIDIPSFPNSGDGCDVGAIEATLSVALPIKDLPEEMSQTNILQPAYPNPFTHQTSFIITVPHAQEVVIRLYNVKGRLMRTIYAGTLAPNIDYPFKINAANLPDGLYLYRASGEHFTASRSVLLVK